MFQKFILSAVYGWPTTSWSSHHSKKLERFICMYWTWRAVGSFLYFLYQMLTIKVRKSSVENDLHTSRRFKWSTSPHFLKIVNKISAGSSDSKTPPSSMLSTNNWAFRKMLPCNAQLNKHNSLRLWPVSRVYGFGRAMAPWAGGAATQVALCRVSLKVITPSSDSVFPFAMVELSSVYLDQDTGSYVPDGCLWLNSSSEEK